MKIVECEQGSGEWLRARRGRPTTSKFAEIVTATGKATKGKSRQSYILELVGERLTGTSMPHFVTAAMQRGTDLEPHARRWYIEASGNKVEEVGFILSDCERWGCSPDGLTKKGGIEIKCPGRVNMLQMLVDHQPDPKYMMQMQGCMFVTGRKEWDFVLFSDEDGMPLDYWTVKADDKIQEALSVEIPKFCDELDEIEAKLRKIAPF